MCDKMKTNLIKCPVIIVPFPLQNNSVSTETQRELGVRSLTLAFAVVFWVCKEQLSSVCVLCVSE